MLTGDLSHSDGVDQVVKAITRTWPALDVVIANAGISEAGTIDELSNESWERLRSINLDGMNFLARATVPWLRRSQGTFLAISSIAGLGVIGAKRGTTPPRAR